MTAPVETTDLVVREIDNSRSIAAFATAANFDTAQRMAIALSRSTMVPKEYQGDVANCLVAMEMAARTGASVLAVMQNMSVINGRPSLSAAFLIGSVNQCGRFSPLRYQLEGHASTTGWRCRAIAKDLASGELLEGVWITWEMASAEGWVSKERSKWKTMPEQMIRYRAASFWTRIYAPDISLGMRMAEEVEDIGPAIPRRTVTATVALNEALDDEPVAEVPVVVAAPEPAKTPLARAKEVAKAAQEFKKPVATSSVIAGMCKTCFRTDGSHDPNAPCYEG